MSSVKKTNISIYHFIIFTESAVDAMQLDDEEYEESYEKFDYHSVNRRPFDDENYIKELAANYWKTIMYNFPYYGADMAGKSDK